MLRRHPAAEAIKDLLRAKPAPAKAAPVLDDAAEKAAEEAKKAAEEAEKAKGGTDNVPVLDAAGLYQDSDIALKAVAAVQEWAETPAGDLEEGEGSGDRLFSLLAGIADSDFDGDVSDDEAEVINAAANIAADYLIAKGVPESDAVSLLEEFDNELADTVQELTLSAMPDGDAEAAAEIDGFVFGDGSDEDAMDSVDGDFAAVLDATYRKKVVVRRGKKIRINKRVSGRVRLSAKQKIAVRKMLRKSHSATAQIRRAKSMRVRKRAGM